MHQGERTSERLPLEPMDPQLTSIQPGGGFVIRIEQGWGQIRRWWLRNFRRGYVAKMESLRQGDFNPCPHPVLDPRDLKFHRNLGGWHWRAKDDPFAWRDQIPFARAGLAELLIFSLVTFGGAACCIRLGQLPLAEGPLGWVFSAGATVFTVIGLLIVWFFRDPPRGIPAGQELVVSPADGKIVTIVEIDHDEYIGGPAVLIGIFLSIFNVHVNRAPSAARIIGLTYRKGKYLNALKPESARENEQLAVRMEGVFAPHRRMIVRQIAGAIARRIVCWIRPGDELSAGERFGMIKLGSRTEIVLPREAGLRILVEIGQNVKAGSTLLAEFERTGGRPPAAVGESPAT